MDRYRVYVYIGVKKGEEEEMDKGVIFIIIFLLHF